MTNNAPDNTSAIRQISTPAKSWAALVNVDWLKYLERKRLFFIYFCFVEVESKRLAPLTGFRFSHYLYSFFDDLGCHYRSARDLVESDRHYLKLVLDHDPRLMQWRDAGLHWNERADELAQMFRDPAFVASIGSAQFRAYFEEFLNILLYGVTVPYLVLTAINSSLEKGEPQSKYQWAIDAFEPLRGVSKYPQLEDTMMEHFFGLAAEKLGVPVELLHFATPAEMDSIFAGKSAVAGAELEQRRTWCVFWNDIRDEIQFCYDKQILSDIPQLKRIAAVREGQIKGTVAYKGKVSGRVCIVKGVADMKKFQPGDILVSNCTNPALMPVIRICAGIVTDEGGIMCHAAIVSRELRKPCVIGTKTATHVFGDGDYVELDATGSIGLITRR